MIEMKVNGLAIDSASKMPVVILTDREEKRFLPIWIGVYEADAILVALEEIKVPRPMTHDLIREMLNVLRISIDRVVIHDIKNNTFFAKIHLIKDGSAFEVDSRPSDAIALALRADAPIFVSESVIMEATIMDKDKYEKELREFKEFLKDIKPSDFIK
ncbi:MAG TPA: bifunctional nuclease family protein [Candidatus Goldiibacteriota bacterium]|nr:bifunctional nuclease family protein [Candidatus Goldiibacteriota bacterium]